MKQRKENKFLNNFETKNDFKKIIFYFFPLLHEYSGSGPRPGPRAQGYITRPGPRLRTFIDTRIDFAKKKKNQEKKKNIASEKNKKDIQHLRFPCSPLPKY